MRKPVWLSCLLILALCLFLMIHYWQNKPKVEVITVNEATQQIQSSTNPGPQQSRASEAAANNSQVAQPALNQQPAIQSKTNGFFEAVAPKWQVPIEFYGKVIDENSNPVAGATAQFTWVETPREAMGGPGESATVSSDEQGLFALHGAHGPSLIVKVAKAGYYVSHTNSSNFGYASFNGSFSADPTSPVIFHLRKKGNGERLIESEFPPSIGQIWQLHHDGTPIKLDLLNGSQASTGEGQFKMELWRDISNINARTFDWKLQLSLPGGGIQPATEEFAFQAPNTGYQPSITIDMPATNQNWVNELRTKYYILLPNGNCGRIDLYFLAYNGVFTVHSAINPTGSRNLEPFP